MVRGGRRRDGLASARRAAGYTQEGLAAELHIDRSTVIRWESGDHTPLPYIQPKLARLLGRSREQLSALIDGRVFGVDYDPRIGGEIDVASPGSRRKAGSRRVALDMRERGRYASKTWITPDIEVACDWLDGRAGWRPGTAYQRLASMLESSDVSRIRAREGHRGTIPRSGISAALDNYYAEGVPWYWAEYGGVEIQLAMMAHRDWLDLDFSLTEETDLFSLASAAPEDSIQLDAVAADRALRRMLDAVVLNVTIVDSPLYRLMELSVERERIAGLVGIVPFVEYALTTDLLETELVDQLVGSDRATTTRITLPLRDRYLPTIASVFDGSRRPCSGGVLSLCAIARPVDRHRGPADFVLLTQKRSQQVLNGVGRLSVIPRGFHQPLTDFRADASIGSTLRRELEEELFCRIDVDNTVSEGRIADPMHPNRLSEPMRWLMQDPGRVRFETTGFGFNLVNGNFEYACLTMIDDPEFWVRYGDQIEANWESVGLRQHSSRDQQGIRDLIQDEAWSDEGLFAFLQGLRRLQQLGDERVALGPIDVTATGL
jgi:transcriptional regulator with XRE-family HTH domain